MMMLRRSAIIGLFALLGTGQFATAADLAGFTSRQSATALKETLLQSAANAVAILGKPDGFLGNPKVKIPLPRPLAGAEKLMRSFGMGGQADELVAAMNRAAEEAVPEAKTLLATAVKQMSVEDAKGILYGGEDSATRYFRSKTETALRGKFLPIINRTTSKIGLAQQYNDLAGRVAALGLRKGDDARIENYVAEKALDGLYLVMAEEEKAIRENPVKASTALAKRIFDTLRR